MKSNDVKMLVQPHQTREIQRIIWSQGGSWDNKIKTSDYLYVYKGRMSWCNKNFNADLVDADEWIREHNIEWFSKRTIFNLEKYVLSGKCVSVPMKEKEYIDYLLANNYEITYEGKTGYTMSPIKQKEHYAQNIAEIKPGTIVLATRNSTNEKHKDYTWQATYYGKFNNHYLVDFNGTHYRIADSICVIPTLTKKEAKQKISELFSDTKNVTSEKIRNIIDLIKE